MGEIFKIKSSMPPDNTLKKLATETISVSSTLLNTSTCHYNINVFYLYRISPRNRLPSLYTFFNYTFTFMNTVNISYDTLY